MGCELPTSVIDTELTPCSFSSSFARIAALLARLAAITSSIGGGEPAMVSSISGSGSGAAETEAGSTDILLLELFSVAAPWVPFVDVTDGSAEIL